MSQTFLYLAQHLLGLLLCLAWGPRGRPALCCALGFPVGLAVFVGLSLLVLVTGLPFAPPTLLAAAALLGALAVARQLRARRPDRRTLAIAAGWTAAFAAACAVLTKWNLTAMTYDSHHFVSTAWIVRHDGTFGPDMLQRLSGWGVFQVIAQTGAELTMQDFLYSLPLVLGVSLAALFALSLWHGLARLDCPPRQRMAIAGLVTAALFTTNTFLFHVFYIHTNLASAAYLFGFVVLFWLAEIDEDPTPLPIAFLCLTAFSLQRVEAPPAAVLFLALTAVPSRLPRRPLGIAIGAFTVVIALWYELLAWHVPESSEFLTPARCRLIWGGVAAFFLYWLASASPPLRRSSRWMPAIVAGVTAAALAIAFAVRGEHMWASTTGLLDNLVGLPHWGYSWYAIALLAALGVLGPAPPFRHPFQPGVPVFFAFVLLLALGRAPYYSSLGDSGNRLSLHVLPLVFFYFGLKTALIAKLEK